MSRCKSLLGGLVLGLSLFLLPATAQAQWYYGGPYYRSYRWGYPRAAYYPYSSYYYGYYPTYAYYPSYSYYTPTYTYYPSYSYYTPTYTYYPSYTPSYSYYYPQVVSPQVAAVPAAPADRQSFYYAPTVTTPATPASTSARLEIILPDPNAVVWLEGQRMGPTGTVRNFHTPALQPGRTFSYKVRASWFQDGREVADERTVGVSAGNQTVVDFTRPAN